MKTRRIYVPFVGQYDNIGDIILRRELLTWLRGNGELHIYLGKSPASYDEALGITPDDVIYRTAGRWLWAMIATTGARPAAYVFKPGEIQLTLKGLKEHVGMLPGIVAIKFRGGKVLRAGVGSRNFGALPLVLFRISVTLSDVSFWRDYETMDRVGTGDVVPDLGFGQGTSTQELVGRSNANNLVVSLRGDRPAPTDEWITGVVSAAASLDLRIVVVSQVIRDNEMTRELATRLDGECLDWPADVSHEEQERVLRETYATTRIVVSDRLHVLIAALTEGATPVAPLMGRNLKIDRHMAVIGLDNVVSDVSDDTFESVRSAVLRAATRSDLLDRLENGRQQLEAAREKINATLTNAGAK